MTVFCFTIPIDNYDKTDTFYQHIYLNRESGFCPPHDDVVAALKNAHENQVKLSKEHPEWGPWIFPYEACLNAIENELEGGKLPYLIQGMKSSNYFCQTRLGKKPLTVYRVEMLG